MLRGLSLFLLIASCALRFVHLDADPHYYGWHGHIMDEGRWVQNARSFAQAGVVLENRENYNQFIAPGFEIATGLSFSILGVSRASARIFSCLCGAALLVLLWRHLRPRVTPSGLLLGLAVVAFQADLIVLSRLAVPEVPAMLGELATYLAMVSGPPRAARLVAGGVLLAATLALKATAFPLVPIFAIVALALRDGPAGLGTRLRDLLWFGSGLLGASFAALLLAFPFSAPWLSALRDGIDVLLGFLGLNGLYTILSLPFESAAAPVLGPPALGLWAAALAWFASHSREPHGVESRALRSATIWCVGFAAVIAAQAYFPPRYQVHLLSPLCLVCAHAVTRLERGGLAALVSSLGGARGARRLLGLAILCVPTAIVLAAGLEAWLGALGLPVERLRVRLTCLAVGQALSIAVADRVRAQPSGIAALLIFPVVATALWFGIWAIRESGFPFWPEPPYGPAGVAWLGLVVASGLASAVLSRFPWRALAPALALVWISIWCVHLAPGFVAPRFTVRDASRDLGARLAGVPRVPQYKAEGLFVDNELPWRAMFPSALTSAMPPVFVTRAPFEGNADLLADHYDRMTSYDLYVPRTHRGPRPVRSESDCPHQQGFCVAVYRLRSARR